MAIEISEKNGLENLCATVNEGGSIESCLSHVADTKFKVRTGGPNGKDQDEWFDREYLRIRDQLKQIANVDGDYTVVFAKPGIGYYAFIVIHDEDLISSATFEDRSS